MSRPVIIKKFNSATDFLRWASNAPCLWGEKSCASRWTNKDKTNQSSWTGTKNYQEAYDLALYGWEDGLKLLKKEMALAENIVPIARQRKSHYDVAGHYPNPARAAAGEIFNMVSPTKSEILHKPIVKIKTNFSAASSVEPERVMQWGAAICSYINMLEENGFSVQLDSVSESSPSDYRNDEDAPDISFQFPLKNAGEPLSLISTVFWWAHPSALRRIEFSATERLDIEKWYEDDYGRPANVSETPDDTLYLTIDDSGATIETSLKNIRKKHAGLMQGNSQSVELLPEIL